MHDEHESKALHPIWEWLPSLAVFAYLPFAALSGLAGFGYGARAYAPGAATRMLFCLFVHLFVTAPVIGYPLVAGDPRWDEQPWRVPVAAVLLAVPFLALAYYLGEFRDAWSWADAALAVVPAIVIALLQFRRLGSSVGFVFVLGMTSFLPIFLIGDRLGPLPTFFAFESHGHAIYTWRALSAVLGMALAFEAILKEAGRALDGNLARAALAVLAAGAALLGMPPSGESQWLRLIPAALLILLAIPKKQRRSMALLAALAVVVQSYAVSRAPGWAGPLRVALLALGVVIVLAVSRRSPSPAAR